MASSAKSKSPPAPASRKDAATSTAVEDGSKTVNSAQPFVEHAGRHPAQGSRGGSDPSPERGQIERCQPASLGARLCNVIAAKGRRFRWRLCRRLADVPIECSKIDGKGRRKAGPTRHGAKDALGHRGAADVSSADIEDADRHKSPKVERWRTRRSTYGVSPAASDYLSSLGRGTFGTRLSAKMMPRKAETPVQNKMAMSAWWVIGNPMRRCWRSGSFPSGNATSFYLGRFPYSASDKIWSLGVLNAFMPRRLRQVSTVRVAIFEMVWTKRLGCNNRIFRLPQRRGLRAACQSRAQRTCQAARYWALSCPWLNSDACRGMVAP